MKGEPWLGGYIRETSGQSVYIIRKSVGGRRFEVSTRCYTERAALKQLERFEADPEGFAPGEEAAVTPERPPVLLNAATAAEFLAYCRDVKKNSPAWRYQQKRYVAWWAGKLNGIDLGRVGLREHIHPALLGQTARAHRIATIKAVYAWLRKVKNELSAAEDPTLNTLSVPQARPASRSIRNKSVSKADYLKVRAKLSGHHRAAIDVQAGTAWHLTEIKRFAEEGVIENHPQKLKGVAGVLVCPQAKGGGELRTAVGAEVRAAAEELLKSRDTERGRNKLFGIARYVDAVKEACRAADVNPPFTPGRLRHAVATWAIDRGADPGKVAAFLNHKDGRTTRKFYATHATVAKIPTLL